MADIQKIHGRDLIVRFDGNNVVACRSCEVVVQCDVVETASPASGVSKEYIAGRKTWTVSTSQLVGDIEGLTKVGVKGALRFEHVSTTPTGQRAIVEEMRGDAICKECKITGQVGNLAQGSFVFQGSGDFDRYTIGDTKLDE